MRPCIRKNICTQNFELNFKEWALETFKRWSWEHPGNLYTLVLIGLFHLRSLLVFLTALTKFAHYKCAFLCASSFVSVSTLKCRLPRSRDWAGFCWALFPTAWHGAIALSTLFECLPDLDLYYHFVNQTERKRAWNKFSSWLGAELWQTKSPVSHPRALPSLHTLLSLMQAARQHFPFLCANLSRPPWGPSLPEGLLVNFGAKARSLLHGVRSSTHFFSLTIYSFKGLPSFINLPLNTY